MRKVLVVDTSILCVWLKVPDMETCGKDGNRWDFGRVNKKIEAETKHGSLFVLPLATIIETGNHIAQAKRGNRFETAKRLSDLMQKIAEHESPWEAFAVQIREHWSGENLKRLAVEWPELAAQGLSLGDATIKEVANYYAKLNFEVEIFSGDEGLKAYQPFKTEKPRRRQ